MLLILIRFRGLKRAAIKKAPQGGAWSVGWRVGGLLADLRGIAEGDREEEGGNGKSQDQDVSEALHGRVLG